MSLKTLAFHSVKISDKGTSRSMNTFVGGVCPQATDAEIRVEPTTKAAHPNGVIKRMHVAGINSI